MVLRLCAVAFLLLSFLPSLASGETLTGVLGEAIVENLHKQTHRREFFLANGRERVALAVTREDAQQWNIEQLLNRHVEIETPGTEHSGVSARHVASVRATAREGNVDAQLVSGNRNLLVILFNLADSQVTATSTSVRQAIDGAMPSLDSLVNANSFGIATIGNVDIVGPFTINYNAIQCNHLNWATDLQALAVANGVDLSNYQHVLHVGPEAIGAACGWAGIAEMFFSNSWYVSSIDPTLLAHELGHNFGFRHSSTDLNNDNVIDAEYGDLGCIMAGYGGTYSLAHAPQQDWNVSAGGSPVVITAPVSTEITLKPQQLLPVSAGGEQLVQIEIPSFGAPYFISFRKNLGTAMPGYDLGTAFNDKVYVQRRNTTQSNTRLVSRMHPGQSFTDSAYGTGMTIEFVSRDDTSANLRVTFGPMDSDSDGTQNSADTDDDNDGVEDSADCAPLTASLWRNRAYVDNDEDGAPDFTGLVETPECFGTSPPARFTMTASPLDNCVGVANATQADSDSDGVGDVCDPSGNPNGFALSN
ncbi:MAG: hypothetical protein IT290_11820, partial [Deltaproteobacteria bacterium]|nr:hypothetical protein [Deltaproteobacteria bacterium]